MKKLALLLGALSITATAFAGGKEIVPQGKEVTPVKEVVKEVIVYRNSPAVRSAYPNGSVEMYYRWWGESTKHKHDNKVDGKKDYDKQSNSNRGRLHLQGSINMTEKDNFYFRVRDNQAIGHYKIRKEGFTSETKSSSSTQVRLRYSHKHDFLDGIATSRLHYQNDGEYTGFVPGDNNLEYQMRFNFAQYGFDNDFVKTSNLTLAPKIGYSWDGDRYATTNPVTGKLEGNGTRSYYGGINLETYHTLPWNFAIELNLYTTYANANYEAYDKFGKGKKSGFHAMMEAYLYNTTKLVDLGDSAKLSFYFEGGFDPYQWSNKRHYTQYFANDLGKKTGDKSSYTLYALPGLKLDYQINENINAFLIAGAEMRNIHGASSEASGFVWQPEAWAGFKVTF